MWSRRPLSSQPFDSSLNHSSDVFFVVWDQKCMRRVCQGDGGKYMWCCLNMKIFQTWRTFIVFSRKKTDRNSCVVKVWIRVWTRDRGNVTETIRDKGLALETCGLLKLFVCRGIMAAGPDLIFNCWAVFTALCELCLSVSMQWWSKSLTSAGCLSGAQL